MPSTSSSHVSLKTCRKEKGLRRAQAISGKVGDRIFFCRGGTPKCLIYIEKVAVNKESDIITQVDMLRSIQNTRENRVANLKKCLLRQQDLFKKASKENEAPVEASYVVSELIARAGKPFKDGKFIKKCMLLAASNVCPAVQF